MSTVERLRAFVVENTPRMGPQCRACALHPDLRAALREERERGTSFSVLAAWLKSEGHNVASAIISRHFREHGGR